MFRSKFNSVRTYIKALLIMMILQVSNAFGQNYSISAFNHTWCEAPYVTESSWQEGSFSITSSAGDVFQKKKGGKTLILTLDGDFEFNTAAGTVTSTGNYLTLDGPATITANTITITYTTANDGASTDAIFFSNFQVRAKIGSDGVTGYLYRSGGTAKIDGAIGTPTALEYFGTFTAGETGVVSSSTVAQASTADVTQYSVNNEIISVNINTSAGGCDADVTQFDFTTTGTQLATNITNAKLYYTGNTGTFGTGSLFGSSASPDGSFTISGTQALITGDNYFWLTYDVAGDANTAGGSNLLDATLTSYVFEGVTKSGGDLTTPNPAGTRTIIGATEYHSLSDDVWNKKRNWSATNGGGDCNCTPNGSGVVYIYHDIDLDKDRTVDAIQIENGGSLTGNKDLDNVTSTIKTIGTGYFNLTGTITTTNLELTGTGSSACSDVVTVNGDLSIASGNTLTLSGAAEALYAKGNLTVEGNLTHSGNVIYLNGTSDQQLSGAGTITASSGGVTASGSNKTILAGSNLTLTGNLSIAGNFGITNNATLNISGTIDGTIASSYFTNANGGVLNFGGTSIFNTAGILTASALTNTVNYNGASASIAIPAGNQYNTLISGTGTNTLLGNINVSGGFTNNGTFNHGNFGVTFNGASAQSIAGSSASTFYDLTINNTSGGVALDAPVTVENSLTLTEGIVAATNLLTLNSGVTSNDGTSTSFINGTMRKLGNQAFVFPIGDGTIWAPLGISFSVGDVSSTFECSYTDGAPANSSALDTSVAGNKLRRISGVEQWDLSHVGGTNPTVSVTLYWKDQTRSGTAIGGSAASTDLVVAHYNSGSSKWESLGQGSYSDGAIGFVGASSVSSFSPFTFGSKAGTVSANADITLPVELISFTAEKTDKGNLIKWETGAELNNDYFELQKSEDGINFQTIAILKGNGTTFFQNSYSYIDENNNEESYYRLKQVDFDESYTISPARYLSSKQTDFSFSIYPNPITADGIAVIDISALDKHSNENPLISFVDLKGRVVKNQIIEVPKNGQSNKITVPLNLEKGLYIVSIRVDNLEHIQKLIVQ